MRSSLWKLVAARAEELDAEISINPGRGIDFGIMAPDGKIWSGTDIHEFIENSVSDDIKAEDELCKDALKQMNDGVEDCDIEDCEWCNS